MSQAIIRAIVGVHGMGESPSHDHAPVDRHHAIAVGQRSETYKDNPKADARAFLVSLGRDLHTLINGNSERWKWRCEIGLAQAMRWPENGLKIEPHTAVTIAIQALREIRDEKCRTCNGRTDESGVYSIPDTEKMGGATEWSGPVPMRACPACHGIGKHRWSDRERGLSDDKAFVVAHGIIGQAMREAMETAKYLRA